MKRTYFIYIVIFLCFTPAIFSQISNKPTNSNNDSSSIFDSKAFTINSIAALNNRTKNKEAFSANYNSGIFIQQIGNNNQTVIDVKSKLTAISVTQNGDNNQYSLVNNAAKINNTIFQNGNSNSIDDYAYRSNYEINSQMSQNGNNQNIKSIGSNSISKDMKVNQIGNGASVIILNKLN